MEYTLPLEIEYNMLAWGNLPVLIRNHLQEQATCRALEMLSEPKGSWIPFGFTDSSYIQSNVEKLYGRVVSSKPASPQEIIVLATDTSSDDGPPPPKRRQPAKDKTSKPVKAKDRLSTTSTSSSRTRVPRK